MKQSTDKLNSIEKALQILLAFDDAHPVWGVRQLSTALGFSPATVQRLLQTLKQHDFVAQTEDTRQYKLGNVYFRFLHTLQASLPITRAAQAYMKELQSATQETVHLNVVNGRERVCIDTLDSAQQLKASMPIGHRSPLYAGASSKCLLAFSPEAFQRDYLQSVDLIAVTGRTIIDKSELEKEIDLVRARGYAESLAERSEGLGSLSVPVFDHKGTLLAAMSLAIPEIRFRDENHKQFCLRQLLAVSKRLSRHMGHKEIAQAAHPRA